MTRRKATRWTETGGLSVHFNDAWDGDARRQSPLCAAHPKVRSATRVARARLAGRADATRVCLLHRAGGTAAARLTPSEMPDAKVSSLLKWTVASERWHTWLFGAEPESERMDAP